MSVFMVNRQYANPVHRGDYPDPSIIRVGDNEFWATTTSTEWEPQFPLLYSRDLITWKQVGAVFAQRPAWSRGKFWAPEISQHNGTFFIYYVAEHESGPLTIAVATASRPEGPYTDHGPLVGQASGSIDPTLVTGEDGRRYMIWKEDGNSRGLPTTIWIQALSDDGLRLVDEARVIMTNDAPWEGHVVEGPSVIRRGDWYYLFYSGNACCGKNCNYAVGVARARSVLGPWEKYAQNPIMQSNASWRCPGHGSVVDTSDGRTFYLYHAYCRTDSIYVGRQVLLDEVRWNDDGWPQINDGQGPSSRAAHPFERVRSRKRKNEFYSAFRGHLAPAWQWPQGHQPHIAFTGSWRRGITIGCAGDCCEADAICSVIARPTEASSYTAETAIDLRSLPAGVQAGLCAYGDKENAVGVSVRDGRLLVFRRSRGRHRTLLDEPLKSGATLRLRMKVSDGFRFAFSVSLDGLRWRECGNAVHAPHLCPWDRGLRVALSVGGAPHASARFKWLRIRNMPAFATGRGAA